MLILTRRFYTADVSPLLKLAMPLILTGLIESASPFFGTIFLAQLGHQELAAGALVREFFFTLMVVLWGMLTAVSVLISQKHGEKNDAAVSQILRDGAVLSLLLTPPAFLLLWYVSPIFLLFGQNQTVVALGEAYLHGLAWGILPDFITLLLLQFLIGLGLVFMLFWVPLAIFLNYVLIFGAFGMPKLGISGIGWGLTISYWLSVTGLIIYLVMNKTYKHYILSALSSKPYSYLGELLKVGLPMGAMYCLEVGFFFVLIVLMGLIGEIQLAATQIVMQYLGALTSVVFSIANAITIRMGHKIGENDIAAANCTSQAGIFLSVSFMLIVACFYLLAPDWLIAVDLNVSDPENASIIHYAKQFFVVCALFQLLEAARISLFGSLRALKDTKFTLLASVVGFWLIPLPLGLTLSQIGFGGTGLWWGMVVGVACNTVLLYRRYHSKVQHFSHSSAS